MSRLALGGGTPARTLDLPKWPVADQREEDALIAVLRSGNWGRLSGSFARSAEEAFAQFVGTSRAIAFNSGHTALRMALLALDPEPGAEVIVPPYTFVASAAAIVSANLTPVFADIDSDSFCIDPAAAEAAITPRTCAIMPVHLGGQIADMDGILEVAGRHGLAVVEDASHAHGSIYNGLQAGAIGDVGCFSLQASKNLNCGEGGLATTDDPAIGDALQGLMDNGRIPGGARYGHPTYGGNYRLTEFQAAVLSVQLERLEEQTRLRDANNRALAKRVGALPGFKPQVRVAGTERNATHLWCFHVDPAAFGVSRDRVLEALRAEGVPVGPGYATLVYELGMFRDLRFATYDAAAGGYDPDPAHHDARCPVAQRVSKETGAWMPQNTMLASPELLAQFGDAFEKVWEHREALRA